MNRDNIYITTIKFLIPGLLAFLLLNSVVVSSQNISYPDATLNPDTTKVDLIFPFNDFTGNPYYDEQNSSPLFLNQPSNIEREIIYNPETNSYEFVNKVGDFMYRPPTTMDFDEYQKYALENDVSDYWNERNQTAGTAEGERLIPKIYIGGEAFDRIFGSNTIDIRPQGAAEVSFGILSTKRDDPALDVRQRKTTNFDFNMKIQMNVVAKIGDKIEFKANYNTESSFDFENTLKLKYEGKEDEIIKLIEAGNVSLPLRSTLISGSQSLFGVKTELQFGKTHVTAIFSQQQSETKNITVEGGAQTQRFKLTALDYEQNKHFFFAQFFRDLYPKALGSLPIIASDINITKIELWVTNIGAATEQNRNIVAFTDLGEGIQADIYSPYIHALPGGARPSNNSNSLMSSLDTNQIRRINSVTNYLSGDPLRIGKSNYFVAGEDYVKLENARKLRQSEYSLNQKLGFLSLNTTLGSDQVLAIAFQYTIIGSDSVYQVGEFSDQGIVSPNNLVVKLLKSNSLNTKMPMWNLMMKNVYAIGAYQVQKQNFMFNILYSGNKQGVPTGYFTEGPENVIGVPLIHLFGLDNLDNQLNPIPGGDGMFDFIDNATVNGGTIQSSNGRLYFTSLEPFGSYIRDSIFPNNPNYAKMYAYDSLYTMTKAGAEQFPDKNKFLLEGMYSSSGGSDISLNALNVPQGSVVVTAGGVPLTENVDYTVDYTLGRVNIINEGIMNSGVPINVSLESNSMFNVQQKRMMGIRVDHEINKDFHIGGTLLNLHERPLTQKINYGDDPISNTMWGIDMSYRTESRWLTKMIDKLPGISTKEISQINVDGEFAQFIPGHSKAIGKSGTSYIDDFEGASSSIDLKNTNMWFMASTPQGQPGLFPEAQLIDTSFTNRYAYGKNRAKLAWYIIDPLFYDIRGGFRPPNVDRNEISKNSVRQILQQEVFPNKDFNVNNIPTNIAVLNLAYYPSQKGSYNYDVDANAYSDGINEDGELNNPQSRWGGMMREIESSDFEAANIEYIEFWMMDPFTEDHNNKGSLYINLGEISEDILKDGRKSYENGLPTSSIVENVDTTIWGRIPSLQALVESFSSAGGSREFQDVGYDGISTDDERSWYNTTYLDIIRSKYGATSNAYLVAETDPSTDDYHYFRGSDYDSEAKYASIAERYKKFNNSEGNSPADEQNPEAYPTAATNLPNVEDINRDNTLSESERYFQYKIELDPTKMEVGQNYITDVFEAKDIKLANSDVTSVHWYQFKIPVQNPDDIIGNISDFRSIRFMRLFMRDFERPIVTRFATFELVRGEWRRYNHPLLEPGDYPTGDYGNETNFTVATVNIEENGKREPIPYVIPPGIERESNFGTTSYVLQNEQSVELKVSNLFDGDARGIFKTTDFDFRQYKRLKMFVHAEKMFEHEDLEYGDMTAFIRIGSDFTHNFYEYEVSLEFTSWGTLANAPDSIWPEINNFDIDLQELVHIKQNRNIALRDPNTALRLDKPYTEYNGNNKVTILGSPSISDVKGILIGVRNPKQRSTFDDDGNPRSAIIWVDELRLTDFNDHPGWAATGRFETDLADLGRVVVSGSHSSAGFSSLEKKISQIPLEYVTNFMVATDIELGKFLGEKAGVRIPLHYDYAVTKITPKYNPLDPDVLLEEELDTYDDKQLRDSVRDLVIDNTIRQNINFMNVRKDRVGTQKKQRIYDVENLNVSFAYSQNDHRDIDFEYDNQDQYRGGLGYNFSPKPKNYKPLEKTKLFSGKYLKLVKDFNFYLIPKMLGFRTDMDRTIRKMLYRDKSLGDIIIKPTTDRQWSWTRTYDFKYDFSRSLTFEFNAGANAYIREPVIYPDKDTQEWEEYKQAIWRDVYSGGTMQRYNQSFKATYNVPFKKIPIIDWVTVAMSYQALYKWTASPYSVQQRIGNSIENSNQKQLNGKLEWKQLYDKIPYFKKLNNMAKRSSRPAARPRGTVPAPPEDVNDTIEKPKINYAKIIGEGVLKTIMSIKTASVTYSSGYGMLLPGFMPEPDLMGINLATTAPGLGFVFGDQRDIKWDAAKNGWISADTILNNPYLRKSTESISYKVNADILGSLRIDIDGDRIYASNYRSYFRNSNTNPNEDPIFDEFTPVDGGNFSISYSIIKTSFAKTDTSDISEIFNNFLNSRREIAYRLASENRSWDHVEVYDSLAGSMYPRGYTSTSQTVLYYAFLSAYSGQNNSEVNIKSPFPTFPIPNWRVTFNGLTKIKAIGKLFRTVNITHGYRSMLSIASWTTNVDFDPLNSNKTYPNSYNYITRYDVGIVSVMEQYSPLIGVDVTMHNSLSAKVEFKKSRKLDLSFVNNQLTEVAGNEVVVGMGYRIKNLKFTVGSMSGGGKKQNFKSDLNLKIDFSIRDNKTTLRRIDEVNNQVSAGTKQYTLNFSGDYMLSQSIQLKLYYNWTSSNPYVSSQMPNSTTSGGFSLRFNLAQ
ncbi:MAG: cell surface protein SprA [Bacteroidetes bacterium]|nr:cell surface protein SprA [Bacteroidota bacterium]MBL6944534.1 cell surface protein SprA [Bacteroidales bacterium]